MMQYQSVKLVGDEVVSHYHDLHFKVNYTFIHLSNEPVFSSSWSSGRYYKILLITNYDMQLSVC